MALKLAIRSVPAMHPATTGRKADGSPGLMTWLLEVELMAEAGGS